MADHIPSFEQNIEADMRQLAAEIKQNREHPEFKNASERAILKEAIRSFPRPDASVPVAAGQTASDDVQNPLPDYVAAASPEVKLEIEYLIDIAFKQGVGKALTESEKSPYFVQDAFHDALAGKLYPELQKRGLVK